MPPNKERVDAKIRFLDVLKKRKDIQKDERLPAGQTLVKGFPVLDLGVQPEMDLSTWRLHISGTAQATLSLDDLKKLGTQQYTEDFHCVTTWSKYDVKWEGIPLTNIIAHVNPGPWKYMIQYGADDYSTNVTKEDITEHTAFLAYKLDGKSIPKEHGSIRIIIPHLFGWKGSKFLTGIEFSMTDKPGFWEVRGYHNRGDAFKNQRFGVSGVFNKLRYG